MILHDKWLIQNFVLPFNIAPFIWNIFVGQWINKLKDSVSINVKLAKTRIERDKSQTILLIISNDPPLMLFLKRERSYIDPEAFKKAHGMILV